MKLCLINQYYPPDTAPTGQYLHQLATALVARGHEVEVLCARRSYNGSEVYPSRQVIDGVRVRRLWASGFGRKSGAGKMLDYASFYLTLAGALVSPRRRPDLLVSLTTPPYAGLLACAAARWRGIPHTHWIMDLYPDVLVAHGSMKSTSQLYRLLECLTRGTLLNSPLVATLGDDMAARVARYREPGRVVESHPLWSDPALTPWEGGAPPAFRREQGWGPEDLVLMYSGNMGRGHRLGEFLEAAARTKSDPRIHWVFAGGGKRREEVEQALRDDPRLPVTLLPYAPAERLREHLCSADVHLVSLDEAWQGCMVPSKFQGIFAVGKPVIFVGASANSLAQWIHASGGGWVVPPDDVTSLLAAVSSARDPVERQKRGAAAHAFARRVFDRQTNISRLSEALLSACNPSRGTAGT